MASNPLLLLALLRSAAEGLPGRCSCLNASIHLTPLSLLCCCCCCCCFCSGLSLKDYLEGREAQHNELMMRVYGGKSAMRLDDDTTYLDSEVRRAYGYDCVCSHASFAKNWVCSVLVCYLLRHQHAYCTTQGRQQVAEHARSWPTPHPSNSAFSHHFIIIMTNPAQIQHFLHPVQPTHKS
jgi:hypothetical protein